MLPRRSLLMLSILCFAAPALAQRTETVRIRATIDAIDASSMKVTTRGGDSLTLTRDPKLSITAIIPANLGDISPGSYIGVTASARRHAPRCGGARLSRSVARGRGGEPPLGSRATEHHDEWYGC